MVEIIKGWDDAILLFINAHHNSFWDTAMWFASGTISWFPLYAFIIILLIVKFKKQSWLLILLIIPLIVMSDQLASGLIKPLLHRLRPSHEPNLDQLLHYVNQYRGGLYSFPSSHACNFFAWVTYLSVTTVKKIKWLPYLLIPVALFVSYSRIYLGVHYPSDIIGGAILGTFLGWVVSNIYAHYNSRLFFSTIKK
ncbi:MAG: phosphatase PAP2 family protein [Bacteroidota bacterium]|nr:phosphatase PAP2 family protein [Bacteroidota bacterium]